MTSKVIKNLYKNLLTWEELEYLINVRPLLTYERVHFGGKDNCKWEDTAWCLDNDCFPPSTVGDAIRNGVCYFLDMSKSTEKINRLCKVFERKYQKPVDAHVYACKNLDAVHPFGTHFDYNNNIIVQCEGVTNFKVWYDWLCDPKGDNGNLTLTEDPFIDCDLEPGDAIFIPAFFPHRATSITERLSVSFPTEINSDSELKFEDRTWIKL
jgi:hypothetical protein|tara:strand:+ start:127 stop:756 length:630 start_codon:yes stop_codon:yes gene_type:complete